MLAGMHNDPRVNARVFDALGMEPDAIQSIAYAAADMAARFELPDAVEVSVRFSTSIRAFVVEVMRIDRVSNQVLKYNTVVAPHDLAAWRERTYPRLRDGAPDE